MISTSLPSNEGASMPSSSSAGGCSSTGALRIGCLAASVSAGGPAASKGSRSIMGFRTARRVLVDVAMGRVGQKNGSGSTSCSSMRGASASSKAGLNARRLGGGSAATAAGGAPVGAPSSGARGPVESSWLGTSADASSSSRGSSSASSSSSRRPLAPPLSLLRRLSFLRSFSFSCFFLP